MDQGVESLSRHRQARQGVSHSGCGGESTALTARTLPTSSFCSLPSLPPRSIPIPSFAHLPFPHQPSHPSSIAPVGEFSPVRAYIRACVRRLSHSAPVILRLSGNAFFFFPLFPFSPILLARARRNAPDVDLYLCRSLGKEGKVGGREREGKIGYGCRDTRPLRGWCEDGWGPWIGWCRDLRA